jgi:3-hydroxyisobutyrate dehydrogenase-like beta-hydroxyacid dehydrogenase
MVADDEALEAVTWGRDGLLEGLGPGGIHVNMTTTSVAMTRRLDQAHAARGTRFVAAPVFGRPDRAAARTLWICAAGRPEAVEACRPVLAATSQDQFILGPDPVQAAVVKIAVNFQLAASLVTMAEGFALAGKAGVQVQQLLEILNTVQFQTPTYKNYGQRMCDEAFDPAGFKLWLGLKDVRLVLAAGDALDVPLPVASVLRDHFLSGMAKGLGELDWSVVSRVVRADAGMA